MTPFLGGGGLPAAAERLEQRDRGIEALEAHLRELVHSLYGVGYKYEP